MKEITLTDQINDLLKLIPDNLEEEVDTLFKPNNHIKEDSFKLRVSTDLPDRLSLRETRKKEKPKTKNRYWYD